MKKRSKWVLMMSLGVCLSVFLAIPLFAVLEEKNNTKSVPNCSKSNDDGYLETYPNPNDCSTFYECSNGVPVLVPCPSGLYYAHNLRKCAWEWDTSADFNCTRK